MTEPAPGGPETPDHLSANLPEAMWPDALSHNTTEICACPDGQHSACDRIISTPTAPPLFFFFAFFWRALPVGIPSELFKDCFHPTFSQRPSALTFRAFLSFFAYVCVYTYMYVYICVCIFFIYLF